MITAIIADDEPLARKQLRDLAAEVPWLNCVGEATDGMEAVATVNAHQPDLIFLDIQMPGMSGLEVLEHLAHRPAVIFTTAYDKYAVAAFELQALDYLLKPFGRARFRAAVDRVRGVLGEDDRQSVAERSRSALTATLPISRLFVRERGRILPLPVSQVEWIEARDDYVGLHTGGHRHLVHLTMNELERMLDPHAFIRIHRCHIVNLDFIATISTRNPTRLEVVMADGTALIASRARAKLLRDLAKLPR
jgi:two-component system, LytTR family, response regulator